SRRATRLVATPTSRRQRQSRRISSPTSRATACSKERRASVRYQVVSFCDRFVAPAHAPWAIIIFLSHCRRTSRTAPCGSLMSGKRGQQCAGLWLRRREGHHKMVPVPGLPVDVAAAALLFHDEEL